MQVPAEGGLTGCPPLSRFCSSPLIPPRDQADIEKGSPALADMIEGKVLATIPHAIAARCCALPLEIQGRELIIAMAEPQNLGFLTELRFRAGLEISPRFSFRDDILTGIKIFYADDATLPFSDRE